MNSVFTSNELYSPHICLHSSSPRALQPSSLKQAKTPATRTQNTEIDSRIEDTKGRWYLFLSDTLKLQTHQQSSPDDPGKEPDLFCDFLGPPHLTIGKKQQDVSNYGQEAEWKEKVSGAFGTLPRTHDDLI